MDASSNAPASLQLRAMYGPGSGSLEGAASLDPEKLQDALRREDQRLSGGGKGPSACTTAEDIEAYRLKRKRDGDVDIDTHRLDEDGLLKM